MTTAPVLSNREAGAPPRSYGVAKQTILLPCAVVVKQHGLVDATAIHQRIHGDSYGPWYLANARAILRYLKAACARLL